ncbi:Radical SAM domain protein, partial [methanotrophic bacterial endosymbiont of Bathymodiolus sp.]
MSLRIKGHTSTLTKRTVGRVSRLHVNSDEKNNTFLAITDLDSLSLLREDELHDYAALLLKTGIILPEDIYLGKAPIIAEYAELPIDGTILAINPNGHTFKLYRPDSSYNALFVTNSCNSNCIMCPQPPSDDNIEAMTEEQLKVISLISDEASTIGITGGEPLLLGHGLVKIIKALRDKLPNTAVHILTNGRLLAYNEVAKEIATVAHPDLVLGVPLFSDNAEEHDYIVQKKGAFDQTVVGLMNAARFSINIEIRMVLHQQTIPRLLHFSEYIYRNFPFAVHISLMGMENMGYVKKNINQLWIDPVDYMVELSSAVRFLHYRNFLVSIYNLQLCILPQDLWSFAKNSISDYKNIYLDECQACNVLEKCGGLFLSTE